MSYDPEHEYAAGSLEATITLTNSHASTGKEFADAIEAALAACGSNLSGGVTLLPNHDETGVIIGSG